LVPVQVHPNAEKNGVGKPIRSRFTIGFLCIARFDLLKILSGMVSRSRMVDGKPTSLLDLGYRDAGIDNGWQSRTGEKFVYHDNSGNPIVMLDRFPNMTNMTTHAHSLGLTMGWYGNNCMSPEKLAPPEMYQGDVKALVKFGFDGIKLDSCGAEEDLSLFANLINATNRPMVIENCHQGHTVPNETWCPFNIYRTSGDISVGYGRIIGNLRTTAKFAQSGLSRPGCWAYPDQLMLGLSAYKSTDLTFTESRTQFGLWAITSAPLILGLDINNETRMDEHWPIISNRMAIGVNQVRGV
jgi:alpha-galactosidase